MSDSINSDGNKNPRSRLKVLLYSGLIKCLRQLSWKDSGNDYLLIDLGQHWVLQINHWGHNNQFDGSVALSTLFITARKRFSWSQLAVRTTLGMQLLLCLLSYSIHLQPYSRGLAAYFMQYYGVVSLMQLAKVQI
jgi:hypothetical protein